MVPVERVNRVVPVFPEQCGHCHQALPKDTATRVTEGEPRRHQVRELPEIQADITEYQMPNVVGPGCGQTTQAPVPPEVRGHFGPRLTAALAYMTVICHIPRRALQCLLVLARIRKRGFLIERRPKDAVASLDGGGEAVYRARSRR